MQHKGKFKNFDNIDFNIHKNNQNQRACVLEKSTVRNFAI